MCKPSAISECPECPGHRHGPVRSHSIPPNRDRSPRVRPRPGPSTRISDSCSGLLPISRLTSSLPTSSFPPPSLPPSLRLSLPSSHPRFALLGHVLPLPSSLPSSPRCLQSPAGHWDCLPTSSESLSKNPFLVPGYGTPLAASHSHPPLFPERFSLSSVSSRVFYDFSFIIINPTGGALVV